MDDEPLLGDRAEYFRLLPEEDELEAFQDESEPPSQAENSAHDLELWLIYRIPRLRRILDFLQGPKPSRALQEPSPLLQFNWNSFRHSRHISFESLTIHRTRTLTSPLILAFLIPIYVICISVLSRAQSFEVPPENSLGCTATYWPATNACGLDGQYCVRPGDADGLTVDFKCPAQCASVFLHNPRTVGDQQVVFEPLIVGGGDEEHTYRGDSFICAAALQAGIISNSRGGCGTVHLVENFTGFIPHTSHGLSSIGFPTSFPLALRLSDSTQFGKCADLRNDVLVLNVLVSALLFMVLRPRPIVLYWCLVCIGFWHVTLFSQPRAYPPDLAGAFGTFLPALFVCYAFWRVAMRFVLPVFATKMPLEGAVLYLGPYWVTVLNNMTLDRLPIDRLIMSDIVARPGGLVTLFAAVICVVSIVVNQMRVIRKTGWLPYYLGWYAVGGLLTIGLALLPTLNLRIHHYVFAMMLIPGTAFPTRLSAVYQGFLLGLFLNGVAAWGFDPILQTAAELRRDAPLGSELPSFLTNSTNYDPSIPWLEQRISWSLPDSGGWDGFSLLIDDVERYVGDGLAYGLGTLDAALPHFFRLAATKGGRTGDFTMPATLWPNGTWVDPLPGPS
ncbi:hypothetical protein BV25DRAFT_1832700 [Artomyces pyxidatus]|uniref:Uncharacterized protein n=1 Tax=Artomyces pyxidatus TaxID=48021 RepID=A0ACB8SJ88_9AGAM|nr:hypothetical protein BV25DRAFT_1832700 [Artomyces pyxidatus]